MYRLCISLLFLFIFQSPGDSIRDHYKAAENYQRNGNYAAAEREFKFILGQAYLELGSVYLLQKNYRRSVEAFEGAATYEPDSPDVLVQLAISYFYVAEYKKALEPLAKVLKSHPESVAAHHMKGKSSFMLSDFDDAINELQIASKLAPKDYDLLYTLGLAYLKERKLAPAKEIYDRMLQQLGNRPQLRVLLGRAYRETGFPAEAIEEFKKAIELDPHFPRAHYYLGLTYLLKDGASRLNDATAEFQIELAQHPDDFFGNYYLGIVLTIDRKWDSAASYLQKASQAQPDNPDPYFYLGQAYQSFQKYDLAVEAFRKAIALNPDLEHNDYQVTNAHFRLGQCLTKLGKTEEGEKELKVASELKSKAFKRDEAKLSTFTGVPTSGEQEKLPELVSTPGVIAEPDAPDPETAKSLQGKAEFFPKVIAAAHNSIGLLKAQQQDFNTAATEFALAAKWNPQQEGLEFNLGLAYFKSASYKQAVTPLESELKAHPENLQAKQLLGLSYFMIENYSKASQLLSEVSNAKPDDVSLYFPLALSLGKEGKTEEVTKVVQQMLTHGGDSPQIHILLGQAAYERGDSAKSLEELKIALSLDSKVQLAHFYSGMLYLKMGKLEEASREFEAELVVNPNDVQTKYHLAFAMLARLDYEDGIKLMREVVTAKPDFADGYFELGKALLQHGDVNGAITSLELAAKLEPDQAHVHYQLGRAYIAAGRRAEGDSQIEISKQLKDKNRTQINP